MKSSQTYGFASPGRMIRTRNISQFQITSCMLRRDDFNVWHGQRDSIELSLILYEVNARPGPRPAYEGRCERYGRACMLELIELT